MTEHHQIPQNNNLWTSNSVIYQIYPRSFKDASGDGIGDLNGIIEKLDYLKSDREKSLNVDAIWLSPIFPSPMADFGYDVSHYCDIDSIFGCLDDFKKLIVEAHKRDLKVMLDYVPNHTSSQHAWFLESRSSKDNPKRDWYIWADPKADGTPPTNWLSVFGGSAWEWDETTKQYYLHTFEKSQPDLNWRNPKVVEAMLDVLRFWLNLGVDGFRVDAVYFLFKSDVYEDEPSNPTYIFGQHEPYDELLHPHTFARPETLDMMKKMVELVEQYPNTFIVTEVYTDLAELIKMYQTISKQCYAPFNFSFITLPWRADRHKEFLDAYDSQVGELFYPTYVLGNHDKSRIASRIGKGQARIAAMLLLTLRGMAFMYYGDEIGMENVSISPEQVKDPWEKNMPGLNLGRDPERTPLHWDDSKNAGFTKETPWLPISDHYKENNVEKAWKDDKSILHLYKKLLTLRKKSPALQMGKFTSWDTKDEFVLAYTRSHEDNTVLVVLNYCNEDKVISLPFSSGRVLLSTHLDTEPDQMCRPEQLTLRPDEGLIIQL